VHALVGENGAGKSTLMKILAGVLSADSGEMTLGGSRLQPRNPGEAREAGISIIYQEFNLLPELTVAQNIYLGREPVGRFGVVNKAGLEKAASDLLERFQLEVDPGERVYRLSVAERQIVEIAKALSFRADLLIMDEPTSSLTTSEIERLFGIINTLKGQGVAIIYVSHRLDEVFEIADRVSVLKDGRLMGTLNVAESSKPELIRLMVGRPLGETFPPKGEIGGEEALVVKDVSKGDVLDDVSFVLSYGEIVGLAGLVGSGRTELAKVIFGTEVADSGTVLLDGQELDRGNPKASVRRGLSLVPEDRMAEGLMLNLTVRHNVALASLGRRQRFGFVQRGLETKIINTLVGDLNIHTPSLEQQVAYLSGGNQQKVALAKWLATDAGVVIFDEPTRGIDVATKVELYGLIRRLADMGKAILMISSELTEIIGLSDRILVMSEGRIVGELSAEQATEENILTMAYGLDEPTSPATSAPPGEAAPAAIPSRVLGQIRSPFSRLPRVRSAVKSIVASGNLPVLIVYMILAGLLVVGSVLAPTFSRWINLENIMRQATALAIVGLGQTLLMISGGVDLSVSAVITLVVLVGASIMQGQDTMMVPAVVAGLAVGLAMGLVNAFTVIKLRVQPFIATLGTMVIGRGIALAYTKTPVGRMAPSYLFLSQGKIWVIPVPLVILVITLALGMFLLRRTRLGTYFYAIGGNAEVARSAGISVNRTRLISYVICSLAAAASGLYLLSRMGVGDPSVGPGYEFDSLTATVVGGTSFAGGIGGVVGTMGGVLMIGVLSNLLNLLNVSTWYQQIAKGLIIIVAVSVYRQTR
jgi:ribose transport system ATP-binding protein